jgi:hypothetical protein
MPLIFQNILDDLTLYETLYVNMCEIICYIKKWKITKKFKNDVHLTLWNHGEQLWRIMVSNDKQ